MQGPLWSKTMLVITYDEHGGFYDHVAPPQAVPVSGIDRLGVRVPTFIVSPWVDAGKASDIVFDHTSIAKTIARRFMSTYPPDMGARVASSQHLGVVLQGRPRTDIPASDAPRTAIDAWRNSARELRRGNADASPRAKEAASTAPDGAGQELVLHDFQQEFLQFAVTMREAGLPPGQP